MNLQNLLSLTFLIVFMAIIYGLGKLAYWIIYAFEYGWLIVLALIPLGIFWASIEDYQDGAAYWQPVRRLLARFSSSSK